jgi:subtilisin family serine protease
MSQRPGRLRPDPVPTARATGRRLAAAGATAVLIIASLTTGSSAGAAPALAQPTVDPEVYAQLDATGTTEAMVYLTQTADLSAATGLLTRASRAQHVYHQLTSVAETSQAGLRSLLDQREVTYTPFWAVNSLLVEADRALVDQLATRPEVKRIEPNHTYQVHQGIENPHWTDNPDPRDGDAAGPDASIDLVEWNIADIGADSAWNVFGVFGGRITVASIDTGVEFTHPALVRQYRGNLGAGGFNHNYNWFDPAGICPLPQPCDNVNHGTHVTGTMVGDDGAGNQIGVAPRARWIAAKGCEFFSCSLASLLASGQWMLAPTDLAGLNPRPALAPHVVNNSWGGPGGDLFYQGIINAWVAAGIFPVFAAGNFGPACGTAASPGDNVPAYAVGAYDIAHAIAPFSSRGPSPVDGVTIKPNVSAPGVAIRSSLPGGGFGTMNGTSMAAPHVAGTVALIWSANPVKTLGKIPLTRKIIDATATDVNDLTCGGVPANNNVWGQGRLNAFKAVSLALTL